MFKFTAALPAAILASSLALPSVGAVPLPFDQYQDLDGKPIALEQFYNKVSVVVVSNRSTADAATRIGQDIRLNLSGEPRFLYAVVLNLQDIPGLAHSLVTGLIKDQAKTAEADLQARFVRMNRAGVAEPKPPLFILDWKGELSNQLWQNSPLPEFAVFRLDANRPSRFEREKQQREQQKLKDRVHVFVLGPQGEIQAHYLDAAATGPTITKVRALLKDIDVQARVGI